MNFKKKQLKEAYFYKMIRDFFSFVYTLTDYMLEQMAQQKLHFNSDLKQKKYL